MEFVTSDGKLSIENGSITQKRVLNWHFQKYYLHIAATIFFIYQLQTHINKANKDDSSGLGVITYSLFLIMYLIFFMEMLLCQCLKKRIKINRVKRIEKLELKNQLEVSITLKLKSNRYKVYLFRKLEVQHDQFINQIMGMNNEILFINHKDNNKR